MLNEFHVAFGSYPNVYNKNDKDLLVGFQYLFDILSKRDFPEERYQLKNDRIVSREISEYLLSPSGLQHESPMLVSYSKDTYDVLHEIKSIVQKKKNIIPISVAHYKVVQSETELENPLDVLKEDNMVQEDIITAVKNIFLSVSK